MKRVLVRLFAFLVFALLVQGVSYVSRIDVVEDITMFSHFPYVMFLLAGAGVSFALDLMQIPLRRPLHKCILDVSVLVSLFFCGVVIYPHLVQLDGIAGGITIFLIGYWIILVGVFRLAAHLLNSPNTAQAEESRCAGSP